MQDAKQSRRFLVELLPDTNEPVCGISCLTMTTRVAVGCDRLIRAFRSDGHLFASIDPLGLMPRHSPPGLCPSTHGLALDTAVDGDTAARFRLPADSTVGNLRDRLHGIYCSSIGAETQVRAHCCCNYGSWCVVFDRCYRTAF